MKIKRIKEEDRITLTLEGDLTIGQALDLKAALLDAQKETMHLSVKVEEVTAIDITGLQLLCSTHRTMMKQQKEFTMNEFVLEDVRKTIGESGYARDRSCALDSTNTCLWMGRKQE